MNWWKDPEKIKKRAENYRKNFLKKHGVENPQQLKEVKEKTNNTMRKRYGGVGFESEELEKKSRDCIEERYGERNIMKSEEGKTLYKNGMIKKYGVENPYHLDEIRQKTSESLKGQPSPLKGKTYEEILGEKKTKKRKKELKKSGAYGQSITPKISQPQLQLYELVKKKYPTAILEYPFLDYCLDIAVPELKLCFEYDGSYWHDPEKDKIRDEVLSKFGWTVKRFVDELPTLII